jgi:uncharacterized surface protein with fasciclin (FAS1) repeats
VKTITRAVVGVAVISATLGTAAVPVAYSGSYKTKPTHKDIVQTAAAAGSFKTLAAALDAGGLTETLKGKGPFTVFAPTDEAFAKLPAGTVEELLKPENREKLRGILTYHVVPNKASAATVVKAKALKTVNGKSLAVSAGKTGVKVGEANVVKTDIEARNGVIHVIDTVLIP